VAELVFSRYSEAFFDLAQQSGQLERFADDARLLQTALDKDNPATDSQLRDFLYHPQISEASKIQLVETSLRGKVSDDMLGLVAVVIKKQRERELHLVLGSFLKKG
jgi:F-type H+-transporting ATPase subunit delta